MIFLTTGTVLPFDRLVRTTDAWAAKHRETEVVAQIGPNAAYEPQHMRWFRMLTTMEFRDLVQEAHLLIGHAGTGTYFTAAEMRRRVVLFPRRAAMKEHINDHQVRTALWLRGKPGAYVAMTEKELPCMISEALSVCDPSLAVDAVPPYAPGPFLDRLREALVSLV